MGFIFLIPWMFFGLACRNSADLYESQMETVPPEFSTGRLLVQMKDAPLDNLVKFEITVDSIVLAPGDVEALAAPVEIELTSLQMTVDTVQLSEGVEVGTYTSATFTFSNPEIKYCPEPLDAGCSSPIELEGADLPLQSTTATVNVDFTVSEDSFRVVGAPAALLVDFDIQSSVLTDVYGNITGVNPTLTAVVRDLDVELNEFEEEGLVLSVNRSSLFEGSFVLELFTSCAQITLSVNPDTVFDEFFDEALLEDVFASLEVGQLVEVHGDMNATGDIVATEVEFEDDTADLEAEGVILALDVPNNQFTFLLQKVIPCGAPVLAGDVITVTVDNVNTTFRIDEDDLAVDETLFDQFSDLTVGQRLDLDPVGDNFVPPVTADKLKLEDQTIRGTVAEVIGLQVFELAPDATIIEDTSITVNVAALTEFEDNSSVGELFSTKPVRVKGLLLKGATGLILEAKKVDPSPES